MPDIKKIYSDHFLQARNEQWMTSYRKAVDAVQLASEDEFRSREFQKGLWEIDGVSSIGPGASVTVPGAYDDTAIIDALWSLREWSAPSDPKLKAQHLDSEFQRILSLTSPKHNKRRPSARLVRIFCALRPYDFICLMDARRTAQFRQWLGLPRRGLGFIAQNVLARQVLRDELGTEPNLDEAISYNQFAWFVWEMIDSAENSASDISQKVEPGFATDAPKLAMLPAAMQRKGMFYVADNLRLLLSVVRATENGMDREGLVNQIVEEAPNLKRSSCENVVAQAVSLNLLSLENGSYTPTNNGRGLLEGENPSDMITPNFVRTVFGFALILGDLCKRRQMSRTEIVQNAQSYYPRWTSDRAPHSLIAWLRDLGLITIEGSGQSAVVEITEIGEYWASGLPEDYNLPPHIITDDVTDELAESDEADVDNALKIDIVPVSIDALIERCTGKSLRGFVFTDSQIRLIHAALHSTANKRFILLAGLSGTGKTSLAGAYARAYCDELGLPFNKHYAQISVWPDWADPSGLIGFVNPLTAPPTFNETPTLKLILEANKHPDKPFFLCLDEMNLARVEHYFAPFLSAMEGQDGRLAIHAGSEVIDNIPSSIPWPRNLFVMGTVNMDETTFPFSDKVLDRAFTFEFWDVDLAAWMAEATHKAPQLLLEQVTRVLLQLQHALRPARRHFGYRTCDEVLGFCASGSGLSLTEALDAAVLAKVLPKVRGDSVGPLPKALSDAAEVCLAEGLTGSYAKLIQMQSSLASLGVTRFWS